MSQSTHSAPDLAAMVADLAGRVAVLEDAAAARRAEVSDEVLLAISAACAAYLGKRAVVKQVHLHRGSVWASAGRTAVHHSHATR